MTGSPPATIAAPPLPRGEPSAMSGCRRWASRVMALLGFLWAGALGFGAAPTEDQIRAVLLFNILKFTDWPAAAFAGPDAPIVIDVIGAESFGDTLRSVVRGERINGRPLVVRQLDAAATSDNRHLVFIGKSAEPRIAEVLSALRGNPVLTVAQGGGFCERGGMVNLTLTEAGTVKPEVNPEAVRASGVTISSRFLGLPMIRIVRGTR